MRIGIDLDNTILDYDHLFHELARERDWIPASCPPQKEAVKRALVAAACMPEQGEHRWQILQSLAYGREIDRAGLFPGFEAFVQMARKHAWRISIISHKSEFSHKDPTVNLHEWAYHTLDVRKFFLPLQQGGLGFLVDEVQFCKTRKKKLETIEQNNPDYFIDDLEEVFAAETWPTKVTGILIHQQGRGRRLWSPDWYGLCAAFLCRVSGRELPLSISLCPGGGNNRLIKLRMPSMGQCLMVYKHGQQTNGHNGARAEARFLELLNLNQMEHWVPQLAGYDDVGILLNHVGGFNPPKAQGYHLEQMIAFVRDLDELGRRIELGQLEPAAHARYRPRLFVDHLLARIDRLAAGCREADSDSHRRVLAFLEGPLAGKVTQAITHFETSLHKARIDPDQTLAPHQLYPSPSDFGLHNCLERETGQLCFLDFEYAGWDDPAKFICDLYYHVGAKMKTRERARVIKALLHKRRDLDPWLGMRVTACHPLVALEWITIVLNVAHPDELARKTFANPKLNPDTLLDERLEKAGYMIRRQSIVFYGGSL